MKSLNNSSHLPRRDFLRLLTLFGGSAGMSLFLQACQKAGLLPSDTPASTLEPTRPLPTPVVISTQEPATAVPTTATPTAAAPTAAPTPTTAPTASLTGKVALLTGTNRQQMVPRLIDLLGINPVQGKQIFLKPNFNSADPTPGSTHPDMLRALLLKLQALEAGKITIGERSGMGDTRQVMQTLGVFALAQALGVQVLVLDELPADGWTHVEFTGDHWKQGFYFPNLALEPTVVVQTCCLKTHRYGGYFTLSLKNSVGLVAKFLPGSSYNYMTELHGTADQRIMIAEVNTAYKPALVVMDGVEAFTDGGPDRGTLVKPGVMLAGVDRVALDAAGIAILRKYGSTPQVMNGPIFGLEQIARAVELGLGVSQPEEIDFITGDDDSARYASELSAILKEG